jgi:surface antigen
VAGTAPSSAIADSTAYSNLGYPDSTMPCEHSPYNSSGACANYDWGPVRTEAFDDPSEYSSRGYTYRNCTDYVAWKLQSLGVPDSKTRGLGNGGKWADNAYKNSLTWSPNPVEGDVAVAPNGNHVAFVENVDTASGSITVTEYNHDEAGDGDRWTGAPSNRGFTKFIHFGLTATDSGGNAGTLWFIKTKNTGSGHVEVHSATPGSGYQSGKHSTTWFSSAEANNGWFQVAGSNLWFIKTKYTGSGKVEVHSATGASGYRSGVHYASLFSSGEADNGWFQMDDWNRDGVQDLIYIKTRNTGSGRVEIFAADGASGYGRLLVASPTSFSPSDASNGWFQEQNRDLVFIKTHNTGSGRVEYFRSSASSNFSQLSLATPTVFYPYDQNNGWFSSEDVSGDGRGDELFIKTHNTGSGHVELFEADGASKYQQLTQAIVTWISPADADNGWFQVNSKQ